MNKLIFFIYLNKNIFFILLKKFNFFLPGPTYANLLETGSLLYDFPIANSGALKEAKS
jgi:hypothetical protein